MDFNEYVGDNSVWVAWRFYSNSSVTRDGPWVDDITIWKYVPGQVTAYGWFYFYDRNGQLTPARYTRVYLYDADPSGGDDLLGSGMTDGNGFWQISPITNWDADASGALDLYAIFETDVNDSDTARRRVTNFGDWAYQWRIPTKENVTKKLVDTFAHALTAQEQISGRVVRVVDSLSISMGFGFAVLAAARTAAAGKSPDEVVAAAKDVCNRMKVILAMGTLEYLHRGGRLSGVQYLLGTALNISAH